MYIKMRIIFYGTRREFIKALIEKGMSETEIIEMVRHEEAHLNKAREIGYKTEYCITEEGNQRYTPGTAVYGKIRKTHLAEITASPKVLSPDDVSQLRSLGVRILK
jgi:hypothetical protein